MKYNGITSRFTLDQKDSWSTENVDLSDLSLHRHGRGRWEHHISMGDTFRESTCRNPTSDTHKSILVLRKQYIVERNNRYYC